MYKKYFELDGRWAMHIGPSLDDPIHVTITSAYCTTKWSAKRSLRRMIDSQRTWMVPFAYGFIMKGTCFSGPWRKTRRGARMAFDRVRLQVEELL